MATISQRPTDRVTGHALRFLDRLFADVPIRDCAIRLWDEATWTPADALPARYTVVFRSPQALRRVFLNPTELTLGEAFIHGDLDVEGELEDAFALGEALLGRRRGLAASLRLLAPLLRLPARGAELDPRSPRLRGARHSRRRDRQAIAYHYDVSNEFYALWLDGHMVYTCAYFRTPDDDLDTAQVQKLDLVCKKLRLRPGERLLDLGCGWGGLALHAARHYGVDVTGVTLSRNQVDWASARIDQLGMGGRCRVLHRDYREVEDSAGFDKIACVGMFEHVGEAKLEGCLRRVWALLRPGGMFFNHGITRHDHHPVPKRSFVTRYVFPDGELQPISTILRAAERVGFEVRDLENLRGHYALTLRQWVRHLEARRAEAMTMIDAVTYRIWLLYMAGSAYNFANGHLNLHQALLAKPDAAGRADVPLTREDWYR